MTVTVWRSFDRLRGGIGPRLLGRVLLFSFAITQIVTLVQLGFDYRRDLGAIDGRMSEIAGSYSQSLGEGLWNLDRRQLELQIEGILRLPAIRFVEIRETTDRADPMVVSGGQPQRSAAISRQFPLVYRARDDRPQLGVLTIEATLNDMYRALAEKAVVIVVTQGATIFLLQRPGPPLSLRRRPPENTDELDQVVAAFESMRQTLERAYEDLRASEQRFRDYAKTASDWFWATGPEHEFTYFS
jgi:hypothetical protein